MSLSIPSQSKVFLMFLGGWRKGSSAWTWLAYLFPKHSFFNVFRWQRNGALGTNGLIVGDIKCFTALTIFLFSNSERDNFEFAIELK